MEFFASGKQYDFMKHRKLALSVSGLLVLLSLGALVSGAPKFGVDFSGGTEIQLRFPGDTEPAAVRAAMGKLGYDRAEVIGVAGSRREYILRVADVSALSEAEQKRVEGGIAAKLGVGLERIVWSPGGDKVSLDLDGAVDTAAVQSALEGFGVRVRAVNPFGRTEEYRYEANLVGVADKVVAGLQQGMGAAGPEAPLRVEWVGPKAGAQLRDAAVESFIYAILFIMVFVAFRFDLRFAPGGIIALVHDAALTVGFVILVRFEFNLQTVAAVLTIVGYSINDTIVIYDRIRENMGRLRDASLRELINVSTSQMMSRTIITSGATMLSMVAFLVMGTQVVKELAATLLFGMAVGVYSTVFIAAPVTEWMDAKFFRKARA